jgi:nucleoside-diphosphate-sugar epimerase
VNLVLDIGCGIMPQKYIRPVVHICCGPKIEGDLREQVRVEQILKIAGSKLPIRYEPAGQTFVTNRVGDPKGAERDLGFKWAIDLEERLGRPIKWRRDRIKTVESRRKEFQV